MSESSADSTSGQIVEVPSREPRRVALKAGWLIFTALAFQILAISVIDDIHFGAAKALLISSYIILVPAILLNIKRPGIVIVLAGLLMNFTAIVANGGTMPLDAAAVGLDPEALPEIQNGSEYLPLSKDTLAIPGSVSLRFLTDIHSFPGPVRAAFSLGDVFILGGIVFYLLSFLRPRRVGPLPHS